MPFSAIRALAAAAFAAFAAAPAAAADFYAGKTIEFTVGADVAGGYDIYARAIAKYLPRYIPGNPTIVVKNLPGAGSGKAATYIATAAPKDGTAIGAIFDLITTRTVPRAYTDVGTAATLPPAAVCCLHRAA